MLFPHTENYCVHTASEVKTMGFHPNDEEENLALAQEGVLLFTPTAVQGVKIHLTWSC